WANDKTVTFMPKPIFGDNGSGMHVHQSIWNDGKPLFYDESGYGGLSDLARHYIGGILKHAPSLLAFTNPSVNSYHRLVPGFELERGHHEVGTGGQQEINYKFNTLLAAADDLQLFKYIVKNTAWRNGKTATFMPKPIFGDNGSGMHVHQSIWSDGKPLFYDESGYGGLSDLARHYIGGILKHAPSLLAFTNPSVNSYHRLVPGFEAPIALVYSARNRSACVRIPITGSNPKAKRIEFRCPDPSANPYLAFSALLLAGIDGIKNKIEPPAPIDKNIYELPPEEYEAINMVPTSLDAVLNSLEADHEFLTAGDVFTPDLIETWIDYKRTEEILPVQLRPHPHEFELYYDI
ncbi:MAG: glnA, partial [Aeromicrobium sp.]|uniref:glutamine synthetase family protein n=1 Tax=Aeromicrobium sp. TaxID=1871063 RepID=UPI002630C054